MNKMIVFFTLSPLVVFRLLGIAVIAFVIAACASDSAGTDAATSPTGGSTGTGGSTARMTIAGDNLYAIAEDSVQIFNIDNASQPVALSKAPVDWTIETLFPYGDYVLIGASNGVYIMDNTQPLAPEFTFFPHSTAQDPVVAQDGYAYVTLRSDFNAVNELQILDISDIKNSFLVSQYPMQYPSGLSIDNNYLFICDGLAGLKIFDVSAPSDLQLLPSLPEVNCNDVIAKNNILYVISDSEMSQYDYTVLPPRLLSKLGTG